MSKVNLTAKDWCDLVFEGRNKDYGAYRLRAKSGSRQLKSVLIVILVLVAILVGAFVRAEVKKKRSRNPKRNRNLMFRKLL